MIKVYTKNSSYSIQCNGSEFAVTKIAGPDVPPIRLNQTFIYAQLRINIGQFMRLNDNVQTSIVTSVEDI